MKNLLMIVLGIFLSGCARLPLDSRRWAPMKHVSDIKWGGRSAAMDGKLRMDGFYMSTDSSMGFVFYDDGTCVDFGMEKISVDSLASNMQAELRRKGIRRKIWRYDESGIYTMANDTIKVNSYWSDFFLFQNLWRMMTKRVFVVKSDSEIVEIKRKVIWVDIPMCIEDSCIEMLPAPYTYTFVPAKGIPSSASKLKRHKWLWEKGARRKSREYK